MSEEREILDGEEDKEEPASSSSSHLTQQDPPPPSTDNTTESNDQSQGDECSTAEDFDLPSQKDNLAEEASRNNILDTVVKLAELPSSATAHQPPDEEKVSHPAWNEKAETERRSPSVPPRQSPDPTRFPQPPMSSGYGLPFPPFLANPFMAPFLPQYTSPAPGGLQAPPDDTGYPMHLPAVSESNNRFPYNPYSGGYFLTPSQYQEMMQQYFQSVLAAGGLGQPNPTGVSPASEPGDVVYDDTAECADALKRMKLEHGGRQPGGGQPYPSPWPSGIPLPQSRHNHQQPSAQDSYIEFGEDGEECDGERMGGVSPRSLQSQSYSYPSPATTISENKIDSVPDSIQSSPDKSVQDHLVVSEALASQSDESELERSEPSEERGDKENPTSMLIKKQMTEIEKEIIRKSSNLNIKKVDPRDLERLLREEEDVLAEEWNGESGGVVGWPPESGVAWSGESDQLVDGRSLFQPPRDTRSLNQLSAAPRSPQQQSPAAPIRPGQLFQPHFPQATLSSQLPPQSSGRHPHPQHFSGVRGGGVYPPSQGHLPVPPPMAGMNPVIQPSPYPHPDQIRPGFQSYDPRRLELSEHQHHQMAAARLAGEPGAEHFQQEPPPIQRIPVAPVGQPFPDPRHPTTHALQQPQNGNGNYEGQNHYSEHDPSMEGRRVPDQNGWKPSKEALPIPQEGSENADEPVWVMRESYLRRLKREEERQQQRERREEQLALVQADRAAGDSDTDNETDRLLERQRALQQQKQEQDLENSNQRSKKKKEVMIHEPAVLIEGVLFRARYLGSTQLTCEGRPSKTTRMMQAQEAVSRIKSPEDEEQPSTEVDLFISTEKIMVLNTDLQRISDTDVRQDIMMDHPLRTISYIADIGDVVVLMARRVSQSSSSPDSPDHPSIRRTPKIICHVFESEEAQFIAQSIGQAFQVAYVEFLRANGIDDPRALQSFDYEEVLNSQEILGEELEMFANKESQKDVVIPKQKGENMGVVVVESGWGSMLPTVVVANLMPGGPASRCNQLNIGDQIIAINGISLVGLPLSSAQTNIKNTKNQTAVKLTVVHTPPVVEVRIRRPDSKYQLGFSVQNGVICSLLRGGIAERGGVRVGHRIIEINNQSVVAVAHEKIVNMLATAVGEIQMKTMPTSMFRLLTGQETPNYI